ncbi:MAG TPA: PTS sugar transporter subunit IIA [Propionicimonas sp.]|nr:PTS sugar transporter subunit IIA [Propionicimonas sp.]HRA07011.1 PTS sugar transporter subunit IIA [Propionicimonas sp.]
MVELVILSVVVAALLVAGVWYLLVRRSATTGAKRAIEPDADSVQPDDAPAVAEPGRRLVEPVETVGTDVPLSESVEPLETVSGDVPELVEPVETPLIVEASTLLPESVETLAADVPESRPVQPAETMLIEFATPPVEPDETPSTTDATSSVLLPEAVRLSGSATDKLSAIAEVGALLVATGAVEPGYVDSMLARERSVSTYMGNLLAIPHGTNEAQGLIHRSAIAVVRYPDGIEWNGNTAEFVVGIAGANDEHVRILSGIAGIFLDPDAVANLSAATSVADVMATFETVNEAI